MRHRLGRCLRVLRLMRAFPRFNLLDLCRGGRGGVFGAVMLLGATAIIGIGCAGDTTPGSRIVATRVLGARVVAGNDATQTWPAPGEQARITWLLAGPQTARPVAWSFQAWACDADPDTDHCAATGPAVTPTGDNGSGSSDGTMLPQVTLTAPGAADVSAHALTHLLIRGVICAGGSVADPRAAAWSRCAKDATDGGDRVDETDVQMTVTLRAADVGNRPPSLDDAGIAWAGNAWTAGAADAENAGAGGPCASAPEAFVVTADNADKTIVVTTDANDREAIPATTSASATREALQLSAFATAGKFDSQFAGVVSTDTNPAPSMELKWTPPDPKADGITAAGRLVRFIFVLRDQRGGIDWTTRTVCLVPSK